MEITELLAFTMQSKGSDLHLSSGSPPLIRISGELRPLKVDALNGDEVKAMLYAIMTEEQRAEYEQERDLDFAVSYGESAVSASTPSTSIAVRPRCSAPFRR